MAGSGARLPGARWVTGRRAAAVWWALMLPLWVVEMTTQLTGVWAWVLGSVWLVLALGVVYAAVCTLLPPFLEGFRET
jgi:hypothetical protein